MEIACKKAGHCINAHPLEIPDLRWASKYCEDCSERYSSNYEKGKPRGI